MNDAQQAAIDDAERAGLHALVNLAMRANRITNGNAPEKIKVGWLGVENTSLNLVAVHLVEDHHFTDEQAATIIALWTEEN